MEDFTGSELNDAQRKLVGCYRELVNVLMGHREQLAPFEERNALKALAALWQVMNGLDLDPGQVYELGA
jgi:hypothetical protein